MRSDSRAHSSATIVGHTVRAPMANGGPSAACPPATPDPLARLRFARWLVETGRFSEEIAA